MPTRIDLQRYKKTYPFLRREPRNFFLTESDLANLIIYTATVSFAGGFQITHVFPTGKFVSAPKVTATSSGTNANFNVFIVSVSSTQVVIEASASNNDSVDIHAIEVLS